jgi:phosphonate transport system permease protein
MAQGMAAARFVLPEELRRPWYASWKGWLLALGIFAVNATAFWRSDIDVVELISDLGNMERVIRLLVQPRWELLPDVTVRMVDTVLLAILATTLSVIIAVPISFLGARNLMGANPLTLAVYGVFRIFFTIIRSIDILIVIILFVVAVGIGSPAGVLALAFHNIGVLGKLYGEAIENIDPGPIEAITATGANRLQVVWYAVLPQIINPFIALSIYRLDTNVRLAPIIGLVGGGGIGFLLIQYLQLLDYRSAAPILLEIIIVVATMDLLSGQIRKRLE